MEKTGSTGQACATRSYSVRTGTALSTHSAAFGVNRMSESTIPSVEQHRQQIPENAGGMYDYLISENCRPSVAAASATYLLGVLSGQKSSQSVIADYFETTTSSISKWYQHLWENRDEWTIERPYGDSELLEQLPRKKKGPDKGPTKEDLVEQVREVGGLEKPRYSTENLTRPDIEQLTGEVDVLRQKELLEEEFGLTFGSGQDGTVQLMVNKSGVRKIRDKLSSDGAAVDQ